MSSPGSTTKNEENQKARNWWCKRLTTPEEMWAASLDTMNDFVIYVVTPAMAAAILAQAILSFLRINLSSGLANFVVYVVLVVSMFFGVMRLMRRYHEACQEEAVEK
jgi:predicted permease